MPGQYSYRASIAVDIRHRICDYKTCMQVTIAMHACNLLGDDLSVT